MNNITIYDNTNVFMLCINGLQVMPFNCLGTLYKHIEWMYRIAQQKFTVGQNKIPVKKWIENAYKYGLLDED